MTVPNDYFGCLRMTDSNYCYRLIFRMLVSDDFSEWLFVIPRLIHILATNSYFHGRFPFQPIIRLIGPTTDSIFNDGFLLQNCGPDPPWYKTNVKVLQLNPLQVSVLPYEMFSEIYTSRFLLLVSDFASARSSHRRCSVRKGVLRNFSTLTGKHLCQILYLNKVAGLRPQVQALSCEFLEIYTDTFFHGTP